MKLGLCIFLSSIFLSSGDDERPHSSQDFPFTRAVLLERFDADGDGRLNEGEKRVLRDAFGGVDVPLLPDEPYGYTDVDRPEWLDREELHEADNTPADNPTTNHGAALGRVLFYDRQLSQNNTIACASCHLQERGFADPRRVSVGFEGGATARNAMGLCNLRYSNINGSQPGFFWDERAATLEAQALMPIQDAIEMGMELDALEARLQALPWYPPLFEAAFGSDEVTSERIAKAIAQFLRAAESWNSKFDRAAAAADSLTTDFEDFTAQENRGKSLFFNGIGGIAEFGCAHCHVPPTFGMRLSLNNGLEMEYADPGLGALDRPPNEPFTPSNGGKFKAPSLRNIELTAPYMHDGRFDTLEVVVAHYSHGVRPHENLGLAFVEGDISEGTSGFGFTEEQQAALVEFLKTLTDRDFVTDPKFSDPFVRLPPPATDDDEHSRKASSAP